MPSCLRTQFHTDTYTPAPTKPTARPTDSTDTVNQESRTASCGWPWTPQCHEEYCVSAVRHKLPSALTSGRHSSCAPMPWCPCLQTHAHEAHGQAQGEHRHQPRRHELLGVVEAGRHGDAQQRAQRCTQRGGTWETAVAIDQRGSQDGVREECYTPWGASATQRATRPAHASFADKVPEPFSCHTSSLNAGACSTAQASMPPGATNVHMPLTPSPTAVPAPPTSAHPLLKANA